MHNAGNYLNLTYLIWLSHPSSSAAWLPVDEPALVSIMTHDHAKDLCSSELGPLSTWYVECILECMLEHAVLSTEHLGLTRWFWVQSNHLLITHHFHRKQLSSYSSWSTWSSPSRLPASSRSTSESARTGQRDHSGSKTPRSVFIHPCCSSYMHEATRWLTCWMCGSKADWYGEGETGRLWTWKLTSSHLSPSWRAAWYERLSQKIY